MKILVTGHCGFIGQNFVRMYRDQHEIIGVDKLGYASDVNAFSLCKSYDCDITMIDTIDDKSFDAIINFAAESHVDNSILSPDPFIYSNIIGTFRLLEFARKNNIRRFLQVSTDEVYGDLDVNDPPFSNLYELKPSSPYSASKAAADCLLMSYSRTYGLNTTITRSCNNYGPFQYKEKLIPVVINNAIHNSYIPLYGNGLNVREWIYVEDNCRGIMAALQKGKSGDIYNLGSGVEYTNKNIILSILKIMGRHESLIKYVKDRKGHDIRYALDSTKTYKELGWRPSMDIQEGLKKTITWHLSNMEYWEEK